MTDRYRIHRLPKEDGYPMGHETWEVWPSLRNALSAFRRQATEFGISDRDLLDEDAWDYVRIIPMKDYRSYSCGNSGAQGWRHRQTGWTIPDCCRQDNGTPEVWTSPVRLKQLKIHEQSPILQYIVSWDQPD